MPSEEELSRMLHQPGMIVPVPDDDSEMTLREALDRLSMLRIPFPADRIEKLPKPLFKRAWEGESSSRCSVCNGYHPQANTIHLDYVGHANATDRILEVDPFWEWEPLAMTPEGLPLFDRSGGLWIKLTICGVTRLGYGDGSSVKEVIGDAIRNAAMRFGLALDLWAKVDLHEGVNPAPPPPRQAQPRADGRQDRPVHNERSAPAKQAPNQDALDSLGSVCDENGYDRRTMRGLYADWVADQSVADTSIRVTDLLDAPSEYIIAFAAHLIEAANPEPEDGGSGEAAQPDGASDREPAAAGVPPAQGGDDAVGVTDPDADRSSTEGAGDPPAEPDGSGDADGGPDGDGPGDGESQAQDGPEGMF